MTKPEVSNNNSYINREISWLQFNARVLQEATDESVPLIERLRFLGIFSNNLDEFFKVRYATVKRIVEAGKGGKSELGGIKAKELLEIITQIVIKQQSESVAILKTIDKKLKEENIYIINETQIDDAQDEFIKSYFFKVVSPALVTIILNDSVVLPNLKDSAAYLAVRMLMSGNDKQFALIEIPKSVNRFVELPKQGGKSYIIMVDDLLRYCLGDIFNIFDYKSISAHMIKITRDGELDFESDLSKSFIEKISDSVKHRQVGEPVRFVYDKTIHKETLRYLMSKMGIDDTDSIIPGGRYHKLKDVDKIFDFFETNYRIYRYKHLIVSPHYTKSSVFKLIDREIENVKSGKEGLIRLKMNSISSYPMIDKLYEASRAGVKIQMIVRGLCCLIPGIKDMSENIEVISVVDKFLEHSRVYIFGNHEDVKLYISSADWMTRNIENRVEVSCPIYDEDIKSEIIDTFNISWNDNTKARILNDSQENQYRKNDKTKVRSQFATYDYYLNK